jgi:DNA (cytosine-5)-methyltransferase 1
MNVLTVCSGIGAPEVAWRGFGWNYIAGADIEAFPNAVRAHHFPDVPNWGDMTKFQDWPDADVDLLVGGTPCQSFSVAGLRKGLADPRGNLALTFLAIAAKYSPRWILWENVPGVLSSEQGRDFGAFLGGLGQCGYGWAYRVLDAQHFGVPQRRRRVFLVGYLGDWRRAAAVLFERHSLQGHSPPRREKGEGIARSFGLGSHAGSDGEASNNSHASGGPVGFGLTEEATPALRAGRTQAIGTCDVAHSLRAEGFDASDDGTGRGTPLVPVAFNLRGREDGAQPEADSDNLAAMRAASGGSSRSYIAFTAKDHGADASDISPTLRSGSHSGSHANGGVMPAVAFMENQQAQIWEADTVQALNKGGGKPGQGYPAIRQASAVRRLTPEECEKLQGFPPGYTAVPYRNKPAADGPRYKALGNSMAVPVMRWIGERIAKVEALTDSLEQAA